MRVTPVEISTSRGYRDRNIHPCGYLGLPVKAEGHQPIHKTSNPKSVLPIRYSRRKGDGAERLRERPTNDWLNLRPILWERELTSDTISATLLCSRQEPRITVS